MKILSIDSSSLTASVAIVEDHITKATYTINHKITHSQTLLPMIDEIIKRTDTDLSSLEAIAISRGPGSFTGLRIGSATAKGLGMALAIPLIQVPTMEAMAYQMYAYTGLICPIMDARRDQVYTGLYTYEREGNQYNFLVVEEQKAVSIDELIAQLNVLKRPVVFLGDGVPVHHQRLQEQLTITFDFAPNYLNRANAAALASLAQEYYRTDRYVTADAHTPDYLRMSQAERELADKGRDLIIREALFADIDQIRKIEQEVFTDPWTEFMISETFANPRTVNFVAVKHEEVVGYIFLYTASGEANIANIAVKYGYQGQGIAKTLLLEIERICRNKSCLELTLEVRVSNTHARGFYEHLGFEVEGIRKLYYEHPSEDGIVMYKKIKSE